MFRQLLRPVVRTVNKRGTRGYHDDIANYKWPTLDEAPVPQGSWQEYYNSRQTSFNLQLAAGLVYAIGTVAYVSVGGGLFWNFSPPVPEDEKK